MPLEKTLYDYLEKEVDEKYIISKKMYNYLTKEDTGKYSRSDVFERNLKCDKKIASAITTCAGNRATDNFIPIKLNLKEQWCNELLNKNKVNNIDVINASRCSDRIRRYDMRNIEAKNISPTLTTRCDVMAVCTDDGIYKSLRKLTPKETWRLMDIRDEYFDKARKVSSDAQLYKQAGNGIVVEVLARIIGKLFST